MLIVREQFQFGQATSADIQTWCLKTACLCTDEGNIQKNHKNHSFHISISSSHRVSCSVFFISENLFFGHLSFWRLSFYFLNCCNLSQLIANYTKYVSIALFPDFTLFWHTKSLCAMRLDFLFWVRYTGHSCKNTRSVYLSVDRQKEKIVWPLRLHRG